MAANTTQISDLVSRLWAKTQSGSISWEQLGHQNGFQSRLGDFVVIISRPLSFGSNVAGIGSAAAPEVELLVKRLDGKTIYSTQAATNALGGSLLGALSASSAYLPSETKTTLRQMFGHLSNRDTDLDELLKLL